MAEERFPRRDFLKVTASPALTFGAALPATAQTSASAPPSPAPSSSTSQPADVIFKNAKVITVDANFSIAQAIAIGGPVCRHPGHGAVARSGGKSDQLVGRGRDRARRRGLRATKANPGKINFG